MKKFSLRTSSVSAIAFDLDDTLYDRTNFEHGAYLKVAKKIAKETNIDTNKLLESLINTRKRKKSNYLQLFDTSLANVGLHDKELISLCLKTYRSFVPQKLDLYPGVNRILFKLKRNYHLALITNGREEMQKRKIKALKIEPLFNLIIYADSLAKNKKYRKPHPKPFEVLLETFALDPSKVCYIGDNPEVDFEGALKLGIKCIRVLTGEYRFTPLRIKYKNYVHSIENLEAIF